VALITQYSTMVWFMAGLAVHAAAEAASGEVPVPRPPVAGAVDLAPLKG
jgi:hypothetical protein